jgi:hypothetical protein
MKNNSSGNVHICEILIVRTSTTAALITVYNQLYNSTTLATFAANVVSGGLRLLATPSSSDSITFSVLYDATAYSV